MFLAGPVPVGFELVFQVGEEQGLLLAGGEFADQAGRPWTGLERYRASTVVWFHRALAPEPVVPFPVSPAHGIRLPLLLQGLPAVPLCLLIPG